MHKRISEEHRKLAFEVVALKEKLGRAGLYKTMQAMEPVTQKIGWEIAELAEKKEKEGV